MLIEGDMLSVWGYAHVAQVPGSLVEHSPYWILDAILAVYLVNDSKLCSVG